MASAIPKTCSEGERPAEVPRLSSLDQFRGYTVAGMFLVNFVGSFDAISAALPVLKHHHTYCSYADTIMPHFFLAVGFAYRLTFLRRREKYGLRSACWHVVARCLGLLLIGFVVHRLDGQYATWSELRKLGLWGVVSEAFQRNFFQTLTHIAITSIWIMPVIGGRALWRVLWAIASALLFQMMSEFGYYQWVMQRPGIDGGPLGFLTWTIPMVAGTLAYDMVMSGKRWPAMRLMLAGCLLMVVGYAISSIGSLSAIDSPDGGWQWRVVEPPFFPPNRPVDAWAMSQRAGSVSYLTFGAGFSLAVYALFVIACDRGGLGLSLFRTLGTNALVGYILHSLVNQAVKPFVPKDSPLWYVMVGFIVSLTICYLILRHLEKNRIILKL